jgi:hypothetical protein
MDATDAIIGELRDAACLDRRVRWLRVTPSAIEGTPACVPLYPSHAFELVVHPEDWRQVLVATVGTHPAPIGWFYGVEVVGA